jgi:hypothetical protein
MWPGCATRAPAFFISAASLRRINCGILIRLQTQASF